MMMPRGAPEQKHPKGGESSGKIVGPMHLQLFRSEESKKNRFCERLKKLEKRIFTKNPESGSSLRNPESGIQPSLDMQLPSKDRISSSASTSSLVARGAGAPVPAQIPQFPTVPLCVG